MFMPSRVVASPNGELVLSSPTKTDSRDAGFTRHVDDYATPARLPRAA